MKNPEVIVVSSPEEYRRCLDIRRTVFIEEQKVPESLEIDSYEKEATHFLALIEGVPVGTGRLRLKKSYVKFERIATHQSYRGHGVGRTLMEAMQEYAAQHHPHYLPAMHAQKNAVGFYEKMGWVAIGEEFFEAEIPHRLLIYPPQEPRISQGLKVWNDPEAREDIRSYLRTLY